MSAGLLLALGCLGGAGAVARVLVDAAVTARRAGAFPLGILVVNLSGAFVLGVLVGAGLGGTGERLLAAGLIGSFTTFSTWIEQTRTLARAGRWGAAAGNLGVSLLLGVGLAWAGRALGAAL